MIQNHLSRPASLTTSSIFDHYGMQYIFSIYWSFVLKPNIMWERINPYRFYASHKSIYSFILIHSDNSLRMSTQTSLSLQIAALPNQWWDMISAKSLVSSPGSQSSGTCTVQITRGILVRWLNHLNWLRSINKKWLYSTTLLDSQDLHSIIEWKPNNPERIFFPQPVLMTLV